MLSASLALVNPTDNLGAVGKRLLSVERTLQNHKTRKSEKDLTRHHRVSDRVEITHRDGVVDWQPSTG